MILNFGIVYGGGGTQKEGNKISEKGDAMGKFR